MNSTYDAIFWDNDGVLVDTERLYYRATREALAEAGLELTPELYFRYFLESDRGTVAFATDRGLAENAAVEIRERRNTNYRKLLQNEPIAIAGVRETLETLRPRYRMGIVTSSLRSHFDTIHRRTGLLRYFDFVLAQNDYAESKPAPDPYLAAVTKSGVPAGRCLAIEDAPRGLASAKAAGIACWVVATDLGRYADFSAADRVFSSVAEIVPALLGDPADGR